MKVGNPALRLFALARQRWKYLAIGGFLAGVIGLFVGLASPKLYRSSTAIKVEPKPGVMISQLSSLYDPYIETSAALNDAQSIAYSNEVLTAVGQAIIDEKIDIDKAFPSRVRKTDIRAHVARVFIKLKMPSRFAAQIKPQEPVDRYANPEVVAAMIRRQMSTRTDTAAKVLRLIVESADPRTAQKICSQITDQLLAVSRQRDRSELMRQETYLKDTIDAQQVQIRSIESTLRDVKRENPEMFFGASGATAAGHGPTKAFLEAGKRLEQARAELATGRELLAIYRQVASSQEFKSKSQREGVKQKINSELSELEFRKLDYTNVRGYSRSHPEVKALDDKINRLRYLLSTLEPSRSYRKKDPLSVATSPKDLKAMIVETENNVQKVQIEVEHLQEEHQNKRKKMNESLALESEITESVRDLEAHVEVLARLRRALEEVRIRIVGANETATVLSPAALPVAPVTLSVPRRVAFSSAVGVVFVLSILFLLDQFSPRFYLREDLSNLGLKFFGESYFTRRAVSGFASSLLTLGEGFDGSKAILVIPVGQRMEMHHWIYEVASRLREFYHSVGVIVIEDKASTARHRSTVIDHVYFDYIHSDDVPAMYHRTLQDLRTFCDFVFVLVPQEFHSPWFSFVEKSIEKKLYLVSKGQSRLRLIAETLSSSSTKADSYAVAFPLIKRV